MAYPRPLVLHLTSMHSRKYGSIERFLLGIARACTARGYASVFQYEALPSSARYVQDLEEAGVRLAIEPVSTHPLAALCNTRRLIRRFKPRLIHSHFLRGHMLLSLPIVAGLSAVDGLVHTVHSNPALTGPLRRRLYYRHYDRVLACSEAARETLLSSGLSPARVARHYLGLSGEFARSSSRRSRLRREIGVHDDASIVLANIAFDAPVKGNDVLLDALGLLGRRGIDFELLQLGIDPTKSAWPAYAERLGIADRVHWAGVVDNAWEWLDAADLYVQSSRSEGLPLSILEAMAMALPVVSTPVGGIREQVEPGRTGYLTETVDTAELARVLERAIAHRSEWPQLGANARERFERVFRSRPEALVAEYDIVTGQ